MIFTPSFRRKTIKGSTTLGLLQMGNIVGVPGAGWHIVASNLHPRYSKNPPKNVEALCEACMGSKLNIQLIRRTQAILLTLLLDQRLFASDIYSHEASERQLLKRNPIIQWPEAPETTEMLQLGPKLPQVAQWAVTLTATVNLIKKGGHTPDELPGKANQLSQSTAKWEQLQQVLSIDQQQKLLSSGSGLATAGGQFNEQQIADDSAHLLMGGGGGQMGVGDGADQFNGQTVGLDGLPEGDDGQENKDCGFNPMKILKIAVPHVILISVLLSYLAAGAVILQKLENGTETAERYQKLVKLDNLFNWLINETWSLKKSPKFSDDHEHSYLEWHSDVYERLRNISDFVNGPGVSKDKMPLKTTWTFETAILYTLTVLTACGYSHIDPVTDEGRIFAVGYALLGIPLMFITAADIGKFLSETFTKLVQLTGEFCSRMKRKYRRLKRKKLRSFGNGCNASLRKKPSIFSATTTAATDNNNIASAVENAVTTAAPPDADASAETDDEDDENNNGSKWVMEEHMGENLWFPIGAYFSLMCLYCTIGAFLFKRYEAYGFVRAFHFAFNTVVTVGLGDIVVSDTLYLCIIVAYVIIGLAVVTMCVDLASSHLQTYFQRIHYFGRARAHFLGMSEDIKEMVGLLAALRNKKGGGKVTWNDIKALMDAEAVLFCKHNIQNE
uniref:Potassium channel domain-containing protein n=1 Tax=Romanomermis culicivorax TaxID=13658 RepID=A0A915J2C5_ROMCU